METKLPQGRKVKFCLYARKSSERDELQALSIDSQIKEMMAVAERDNLNVVDIRKESHSAKDSGERPVFRSIINDIKLDKIQGILTWAPDRLSRNAGDLGVMVDLMDQKYLVEIRTYSQVFTNSPNDKFLLMILGSQAKLENDNKAVNVRRGLKAKCEIGYRPGMAPLGFIHDGIAKKGQKKVILDPERAPLIKEMFERVASGQNGRDVYDWLMTTGFTSRSGKKPTLSTVYETLANPYYCGKFEYPIGSGNWYEVAHEVLISKEMFEDVRQRLETVPKPRPGTKEFDFIRLIKCGNCGSGVCAEEKFKTLKDGSKIRYVYYHCTKGADRSCNEPYVREEDLIEQLTLLIDRLDINQIGAKKKLQGEIERYERFIHGVLGQEMGADNKAKVNIKDYAKYVLKNGTRDEKRELLSCLKTKLYLKGKTIYAQN